MFLGWLVLCSLTYSTFAQNFSIPSGWRKPTFNLPWQDCITLSQALIDAIAPQVNHSTGQVDGLSFDQSASLFAAIANYDRLVGNRTNEALVTTHLAIVGQQPLKYFGPSKISGEPLLYSAVSAYRAYGDQYLLDLAASLWGSSNFWMITVDDTNQGLSHVKPGFNLMYHCGESSVAGGVFFDLGNTYDEWVDLSSVGTLLLLSAYMYEATNEDHYANAADLTAEFTMSFLGKQLDIRFMNVHTCAITSEASPVSMSVGPAIEGLSVYASMLPNRNFKLATYIQSMTLAVIGKFVDGDGIFDADVGDSPLDNWGGVYVGGVLVRGLYETLSRIDANSDLAKPIRGFLAVQFNAVLDLARPPNSTLFSPSWRGPPVTDRALPWGQLLALDVLNAGLSAIPRPTLPPNASTSTLPLPSPTLYPSSSASSGAHLSIKSIVGIIVGGVAFIALIVVALLVWQRSKRNRLISHPPTEQAPQPPSGEEQDHVTDIPRFLPASAMYQLPSSQIGSSETSTMMPSSDKHGSAVVLSYASTSNNAADGPDARSSASPYRPPSVEESIPDLVQRLNRAMTRLPPSEAGHAEELEPPRYESTASHTVV
ncbi:unnamed protein product [Somion occarium]|uniref:Glycoside hydrolase family 76 protein n=1 Tax=Somion occarium TaxID=3059160 RepID=A0ABP1DIT0_9APHY